VWRAELSPASLLLAIAVGFCPGGAAREATSLYQRHCASCHGADRLGGTGPALLPENLQRLRQSEAVSVIRDGRPATQMPAFGGVLGQEEIAAMTELIYRPLPALPDWSLAQIAASRVVLTPAAALTANPDISPKLGIGAVAA
jgi:mono/diheme cytochrome c family protein